MTNHWADIGNSTNIVVWGANPVENHPACVAHMNRARFPKQFFDPSDPRSQKPEAKLIVIDPRKTRTALQVDPTRGDRYVRIRPGTDIAFGNGLMRYMISKIEAMAGSDPVRVAFFNYLNKNNAGTFYTDGHATADATAGSTSAAGNTAMGNAGGSSVYTDARFLVNAAGDDYQRDRIKAATGDVTTDPVDSTTISDFPLKAATVTASADTVYSRLKAHVAPYTTAVTANICGCSIADIEFVGNAFIANSRCSDVNGLVSGSSPIASTYRATTMLYAMGLTQHTCGASNVKTFAQIQMIMGNMGRAGGGINALRGIHNVQGSTDMGLLFGNIPAYSANPGTQVDAIPSTNNAFGKYMDGLWGNPVSGTGTRAQMNLSYDDAYNTAAMWLQQRGFYNMTLRFFGDYETVNALTGAAKRAAVDACYSLWPKGQGDDHITMFRKMGTGETTACVAWGQNPAVTEPNQGAVRTGLYNVDLLVCADMFANETAMASRKPTGVTYLLPAAAHVEKGGSATNSGRTLQWRYKASDPLGNSKDDTELFLRLAKALDDNPAIDGGSAFSHIKAVWDANGITYDTSVYKQLYGNPYGGYIPGTNTFDGVSGTAEVANLRKTASDPVSYSSATVTGSEWVAESVYREMCLPWTSGGTIWIYTGAYNDGAAWTTDQKASAQNPWAVMNRAKSRDNFNDSGTLAFHGWGYAWLVNRRVLYNNGEIPGDVADFFMGPDSAARLFVSTNTAVLNYSRWYRKIHLMKDRPSVVFAGDTTSPHFVGSVSYAGRFPGHTEPYESPRPDLVAKWGRNTRNTGAWDLVPTDTRVAGRGTAIDPDASAFPLVLTTIRCVEHFQGGPITRNNWWNVEAEPEPWVEINSADAYYSDGSRVLDGDMVKLVTARIVNDSGAVVTPASYGEGFRARVGSGLTVNQKVGKGVVAIPWHWGEQGLSTGSRANDLTIDAGDANTTIPEYKACLCRLEKM